MRVMKQINGTPPHLPIHNKTRCASTGRVLAVGGYRVLINSGHNDMLIILTSHNVDCATLGNRGHEKASYNIMFIIIVIMSAFWGVIHLRRFFFQI